MDKDRRILHLSASHARPLSKATSVTYPSDPPPRSSSFTFRRAGSFGPRHYLCYNNVSLCGCYAPVRSTMRLDLVTCSFCLYQLRVGWSVE